MSRLPVNRVASRRATSPPPWAAALRRWYRRHRRPMPWRGTRDAYRIWVSEVMLQQTQVRTVRPYYAAFLRRFPNIAALAAAPVDQVLAVWSGLGYYRRARHLHEAASRLVLDHGGRVPDDPVRFGGLPGVGRYTTGAVLSIAFDRPLPVLDGNVARVLSRLCALPASIRDPQGARQLWTLAATLVPMRAPGDWNQALMELGATVCVARSPRCGDCPLARWCRACAGGRPEAFPPRPTRRRVESLRRAVVLFRKRGRLLMTRRGGPLLDGLWEPPGVDLKNRADARRELRAALVRLGLRGRLRETARRVRHVITHRAIEVEVWSGTVNGTIPRSCRWVDVKRAGVGTTALAARLAPVARDHSRDERQPTRRGG